MRPRTARCSVIAFRAAMMSEIVNPMTIEGSEIDDLAAGLAGEHLVCADLLLRGYRAFRTDQNCAYNVAVDAGGRLVRIQVRSTRRAKPIPGRVECRPAYMWFVRRSGKRGARVYGADDFDMLALVALDTRKIAYMPPSQRLQTIFIRTHGEGCPPPHGGKSGRTFAQYPFEAALLELSNERA